MSLQSLRLSDGLSASHSSPHQYSLPHSQHPGLYLTHPTPGESNQVCAGSFSSWGDALTLPQYIEESAYMATIPLAKDGGMRSWILTDRSLAAGERPVLCSCETFRKHAFVKGTNGQFSEAVVYGIASVFTDPVCRGRGYAARLMQELAAILPSLEPGLAKYIGSVLYSDIGKKYYSKLGWHPLSVNNHIELKDSAEGWPQGARRLRRSDLDLLCQDDEARSQEEMIRAQPGGQTRVMIVPDLDHMLWHIGKEDFACRKLFAKIPETKGALVGSYGSRVWAIWAHRYYSAPKALASDNTLYILRFVVESTCTDSGNTDALDKSICDVIRAAQVEAREWRLASVKVWDPPRLVEEAIRRAAFQYHKVEREEDGIGSFRWCDNENSRGTSVEWLSGEKYAWM